MPPRRENASAPQKKRNQNEQPKGKGKGKGKGTDHSQEAEVGVADIGNVPWEHLRGPLTRAGLERANLERFRATCRPLRKAIPGRAPVLWEAVKAMAAAIDRSASRPDAYWTLMAERAEETQGIPPRIALERGRYIDDRVMYRAKTETGDLDLSVSSTLEGMFRRLEQPSEADGWHGVLAHLGSCVLSPGAGTVRAVAEVDAGCTWPEARKLNEKVVAAAVGAGHGFDSWNIMTRVGELHKRLSVIDRAGIPFSPDVSSSALTNADARPGTHLYVFSCPCVLTGDDDARQLEWTRCFLERAPDMTDYLLDDELPTVNAMRVTLDARDRLAVVSAHSTRRLAPGDVQRLQKLIQELLPRRQEQQRWRQSRWYSEAHSRFMYECRRAEAHFFPAFEASLLTLAHA